MATVSVILSGKQQRPVLTAERAETVLSATQRMNEHSVGALIVTDGGRLCGIFTERDVLRRVVAEQRDPAQTLVGDVMTSHVACCTGETSIEEVRSIMKSHRVRHIPVVDGAGGLIGMISIGDVNAYLANDREVSLHFLNEYLHGRV